MTPHGTYNGYTNYKCRCDQCKAANRDYKRNHRAVCAQLEPPADVHGTLSGYTNWGCRCESCTTAHSAYCAAYDQRRRAPR